MTDVMTRCFTGASGVHNGWSVVAWGGRGYQASKPENYMPLMSGNAQVSDILPISGYIQASGSAIIGFNRANCYLDTRYDDKTYYTT